MRLVDLPLRDGDVFLKVCELVSLLAVTIVFTAVCFLVIVLAELFKFMFEVFICTVRFDLFEEAGLWVTLVHLGHLDPTVLHIGPLNRLEEVTGLDLLNRHSLLTCRLDQTSDQGFGFLGDL